MYRFVLGTILAIAALATSTLPAHAGLVASFTGTGPTQFVLSSDGGHFTATTTVTFNFNAAGITGTPDPGFGNIQAALVLNGDLVAGNGVHILSSGLLSQSATTLSFSIKAVGGPFDGANLLSGTMATGNMTGVNGSGVGNITGSNMGSGSGPISYTSDFVSFLNGTRTYDLSLSSLKDTATSTTGPKFNPSSSIAGFEFGNIKAGTGSISGSFDANGFVPSPVPEPATLSLLGIGGVLAMGAARLRRRK